MSDRICHKCPPTDNPPELCEHNTISKEDMQKLLPDVDLSGYVGPFTLGTYLRFCPDCDRPPPHRITCRQFDPNQPKSLLIERKRNA